MTNLQQRAKEIHTDPCFAERKTGTPMIPNYPRPRNTLTELHASKSGCPDPQPLFSTSNGRASQWNHEVSQ